MKMPVADFLDRYSILTLKREFTDECAPEYNAFKEEYEFQVLPYWDAKQIDLRSHFIDMLHVNRKIWGFETELRQGKEACPDLKEDLSLMENSLSTIISLAKIGLAAIKIRNWNRKRKSNMMKVVELTQEGWADIKVNHASE